MSTDPEPLGERPRRLRPDLFAALGATWPPAETRRLGPWTLRRGAGGGNRVSAATLDGPDGDIAEAEAAMRAWGQVPLFMLRPRDAGLDAELAARGYTVRDPVVLLESPAVELAPAEPDDQVILGPEPLAAMVEIWLAGSIGRDRLPVMLRVTEPRVFLLGRSGDRPAGCGFAARLGPIAMLHALDVAPFARRQGLGGRITRTAAAWARDQGATTLALTVNRSNAPACALYASLGMAEAADYHYRVAPGG